MGAVGELRRLGSEYLQERLVDERGGLKRVAWRLSAHDPLATRLNSP